MSRSILNSVRRIVVIPGVALLLVVTACGEHTTGTQGGSDGSTTVATSADIASLPQQGRVRLAVPPPKALFGMIYINTTNNREFIFDGSGWVPHDSSVETYYRARTSAKVTALPQIDACVDGDPACTPSGAHGSPTTQPAGHYAFDCRVCHKVGGRLSFDKAGPAYAVGKPAPSYDVTTRTCSNIACHGVPAGTFSYYFPGGDGEPVLTTVNYGGSTTSATPPWDSTGKAACAACHGDPPASGSNGSNVWHSGYHGGGGPTDLQNQCQFCHPDASSPGNGVGDTVTNASLHANGAVTIQVTFKASCFGCH